MAKIPPLVGNRFEGRVSDSLKRADVNDRKQKGSLRLFVWSDMVALRDRMDVVLEKHAAAPEKLKPYDVKYPEKSSTDKIKGLNYEDTRELRDLSAKLAELLQPDI